MEPRRSSRSNKGQHFAREGEVYYHDQEEEDMSHESGNKRLNEDPDDSNKRFHADEAYDEEYQDYKADTIEKDDFVEEGEESEEEGEVKCIPCGTSSENYDEETDNKGTMIECESCKTWQHAKCMGFKSKNSIPKVYQCNLCEPSKYEGISAPTKAFQNKVKDKTRVGVSRAFLNVLKNSIPSDFVRDGLKKDDLAEKWAWALENEIYLTSPKKDRKYIDKSRSLMALIKKPNVMNQIINETLSFTKLVNSSPEEIDEELKAYAERVRQESIRRSVITVDDSQAQRIRRTHKGEEIVEDVSNQQPDVDLSIVSRNIDHRRFQEEEAAGEPGSRLASDPKINVQQFKSYTNLDEEEDGAAEVYSDNEGPNKGYKSENNEENVEQKDEIPDLEEDDELDFILNGERKEIEARHISKMKNASKPNVQKITLPKVSWSGRITFPDFVSFGASASFVAFTGYHGSQSLNDVKLRGRIEKISKEIFNKSHYEIEGRLDRKRADDYLKQVMTSKDFLIMELACKENKNEYDKLYNYFVDKSKIGVLSGKPSFVKDSYIFSMKTGVLPSYLSQFEPLSKNTGLFALYVIKKDYIPVGRSILKASSRSTATDRMENSQNDSKPLLESILNKLGSSNNNQSPPVAYSNNSQNGLRDQYRSMNRNHGENTPALPVDNYEPRHDPRAILDLLRSNPNSESSNFR